MEWQLLDTGKADPKCNMDADYHLLNGLSSTDKAILRFYEWEGDCATYGYFIEPGDFLNLEGVHRQGLKIAQRPTGGGIVFHLCDMAYSVLLPTSHPAVSLNTLANYAFINQAIASAVQQFLGESTAPKLLPAEPLAADKASGSFCMAKPTKFDVMLDGRKVGGGAQRRTRHGLLHQGTISLAMPREAYLREVLLPGTQVLDAMRQNSYFLLGESPTLTALNDARMSLRHHVAKALLYNSPLSH